MSLFWKVGWDPGGHWEGEEVGRWRGQLGAQPLPSWSTGWGVVSSGALFSGSLLALGPVTTNSSVSPSALKGGTTM